MTVGRVLGLLVALASVLAVVQQVAGQATPCDPSVCTGPDCRCSTTATPGGLDTSSVPQFIMLTFDDSVNSDNFLFYENLTNQYSNPNGCPISMTFFVSHAWTDYSVLNKLHRMGHEIASHSVSHYPIEEGYWDNLSLEDFKAEVMDVKTMMNVYGNIPLEDVTGYRMPFLYMTGNTQFEALSETGFKYDCSWPTSEYTPWNNATGEILGALWPYTLDYASVQDQTVGTKPTDSFPGMWVNPMISLQDDAPWGCSMLDGCSSENLATSEDAVFEFFKKNFLLNYEGKRAPYPLYTHYPFFGSNEAHTNGLYTFLSYVSTFPDVYLVSVDTAVEWTRNPVPLDQLSSFAPLSCSTPVDTCPVENVSACHYTGLDDLPIGSSEAWMTICQGPCPPNYPWAGNPFGAYLRDQTVREQPLHEPIVVS